MSSNNNIETSRDDIKQGLMEALQMDKFPTVFDEPEMNEMLYEMCIHSEEMQLGEVKEAKIIIPEFWNKYEKKSGSQLGTQFSKIVKLELVPLELLKGQFSVDGRHNLYRRI
jgi:hypothetical protein